MLKNLFLLSMILFTVPSFALLSEESAMHYFLVPQVGLHLATSELTNTGSSSTSLGPMGGLGVEFERDHYFFTPSITLQSLVGLDKSPLLVWGLGFIAGGRLPSSTVDVFLGVSIQNPIAYKVNSTMFGRAGVAFDLGFLDCQLWTNVFYGNYSLTTSTLAVSYPYIGIEGGLQFPIRL